ncbi:hypothetical protein ANCDUO_08627 [Ancylostoma duodenale]|uniref:Uncharacterized protein n=1 Tax=Ancylostoma duodenale TaxID=51022 RepID=A0A0C2CW13_9BILA|nr:hypothetical protein ANCDUO_08627 [Ancylostoma duodenale]
MAQLSAKSPSISTYPPGKRTKGQPKQFGLNTLHFVLNLASSHPGQAHDQQISKADHFIKRDRS